MSDFMVAIVAGFYVQNVNNLQESFGCVYYFSYAYIFSNISTTEGRVIEGSRPKDNNNSDVNIPFRQLEVTSYKSD